MEPGAKFLGSVPNFPFTSHVRHFRSERDVLSRYGQCLADLHNRFVVTARPGKEKAQIGIEQNIQRIQSIQQGRVEPLALRVARADLAVYERRQARAR